jgi:hypothetical protein
MATIIGSFKGLIHDTAAGLVDNQIPTKFGTAISDLVTSSFEIVTDVLKVVQDVTAPEAAQPGPPSP